MEAKTGLKFSIIVEDSDIHCPKSHCLSYNTFSKVQTQGSNHKDLLRSEKSKSKNLKFVSPRNNIVEPTKKEGEKKKKFWGHRRKRIEEQKDQSPATSINTKVPKKKKEKRNPNEMTCFNCNKKSHYTNNYTTLKN